MLVKHVFLIYPFSCVINCALLSYLIIIIIIKMFNQHILALKMNYNVITRFGKLQKPNWDWVYKIIKNRKTYKSYINFNHSY